jgi:DNA-directed RNA polymerase subunit RPC12/RpoP
MKFLCVQCDEPMKLVETAPPDRGSIGMVYSCPTCSHRIAMLTNPYETQVVASLGVKIGPNEETSGTAAATKDLSGCPYSEIAREMIGGEGDTGVATGATEGAVDWTPGARERLANIPEFVRPMARAGIEKFARDNGYPRVDEEVLDQAKDFFGM